MTNIGSWFRARAARRARYLDALQGTSYRVLTAELAAQDVALRAGRLMEHLRTPSDVTSVAKLRADMLAIDGMDVLAASWPRVS